MIDTKAIANLAEWARGQAIQKRMEHLPSDAEGMDHAYPVNAHGD